MMIKRSTPLRRSPLKRSKQRIARTTRPRQHRLTRPGTGPSDARVLDLLKQAVRLRDPKCVVCKRRWTTDTMHLIGRSARRVRYSLLNVLGGCRRCHDYYTLHSDEWKVWYPQYIGQKQADTIKAIATDMTQKVDRQAAADELRKFIKEHSHA